MSEFDAYEDMRWDSGPGEREIDRVLAGRVEGDEPLAELAAFVADVRDAYVAPAADSVAKRHLALIAAAVARSTTSDLEAKVAANAQDASARGQSRRISMPSRKRIARSALVFAVAGVVVTGSLAAAGVDIPSLPAQASDEAREALARAADRADERGEAEAPESRGEAGPPAFLAELRALIESVPAEERGCAFGQAVATIASGSDPTEGDPCAEGNGGGEGQDDNESGTGGPQGGPETGDQASGGVAGDARNGGVQGGPETGDQASGGVAGDARNGGVQGGRNVGDQASGGVSSGTPAPPAGGGGGGAQGPPAGVPAGGLPPAAQPGQDAAGNAPAGPGRP